MVEAIPHHIKKSVKEGGDAGSDDEADEGTEDEEVYSHTSHLRDKPD